MYVDYEIFSLTQHLGFGCNKCFFLITIQNKLTTASHMEVGFPGTWGLELLTPNPGSKSTPEAGPTRNPGTSPACHTQPQPKHPSHRARSSVEIIITVITNKTNNNKDNNNKVITIKGRGGWEKTLKHSKN